MEVDGLFEVDLEELTPGVYFLVVAKRETVSRAVDQGQPVVVEELVEGYVSGLAGPLGDLGDLDLEH